ncbi:MAG: GNAT family N-acetyltransferase [Candidatus Angelobacter sp.]
MPAHSIQLDSQVFVSADETPVSVRLCQSWDELEKFRGDWNGLLQACFRPSIFQTPEWLGSWWHAFGADKSLLALIFTEPAGNTVGIALLYLECQSQLGMSVMLLRMVGAGSGDSDALDFTVAPGYERSCAKAFMSWLADESQWNICTLETLRPGSVVARHISELVQQAGWRLQSESSPNFFIDLPPTWPEYLQTLEPAFRPLLTRYPKRLHSRYRVQITPCERPEDLDANLQTLFALHQMRWTGRGEPGAFATAERCDFYFRMANAFLQRGWLEFWLLQLDDETVAAQFCFRYGGTVYLLQEGFNPKYAAEKIGYALRAHVLQEMIRTGATRYDFMGGTDPYKLKFAAQKSSYISLRFAGPSLRGRAHLALRGQRQRIKLWLKRRLPEQMLAELRQRTKAAACD